MEVRNCFLFLLVVGSLFATSFVNAQEVFGDFDDGTQQGWVAANPLTDDGFNGMLTLETSGDNGYLLVTDTVSMGGGLAVRAPDSLSGNLTELVEITWDVLLPGPDDIALVYSTSVLIESSDGTLWQSEQEKLPSQPVDQWFSKTASFVNSSQWTLIRGNASFQAVASNAESLYIEMDVRTQLGIEAAIDNIRVPELNIDFTLPDTVRLDRVRYCRGSFFCRGETSYPEYEFWEAYNVAKAKQKRTYLAKLSEPLPENVEHLVFIAAGQQGEGLGFNIDDSSAITGQRDGYKEDFGAGSKDRSKTVEVASNYAQLVLQEGNWNPTQTFIGLAFDARFNQNFSSDNKYEIENAYYDWLSTKITRSTLKTIYLAGHSRGGCLVSRLATRFSNEYPEKTLIVHAYDPVCNVGQGEFGTYQNGQTDVIDNPVSGESSYFAYKSDVNSRLSERQNLAYLNLMSGAPVANFSPLGFHAFSHEDGFAPTFSLMELGAVHEWYQQIWFDLDHNEIELGGINTALDHLNLTCLLLICD